MEGALQRAPAAEQKRQFLHRMRPFACKKNGRELKHLENYALAFECDGDIQWGIRARKSFGDVR